MLPDGLLQAGLVHADTNRFGEEHGFTFSCQLFTPQWCARSRALFISFILVLKSRPSSVASTTAFTLTFQMVTALTVKQSFPLFSFGLSYLALAVWSVIGQVPSDPLWLTASTLELDYSAVTTLKTMLW